MWNLAFIYKKSSEISQLLPMKKLVLWIWLFPIALIAQNNAVYTIQIGTFVNPKISEFNNIQPSGFVYSEPFQDKFSKVFFGEFRDALSANDALEAINLQGFGGFVKQRTLHNAPSAIVVQFTTQKIAAAVNWESYKNVGKLYTILTDPNIIKLVTGPFSDMATARKRVETIRALGYKDAFVKTINTNLLHEVGDFEMGIDPIKRNLNTAVDVILSEGTVAQKSSSQLAEAKNIPTSFESQTSKINTTQPKSNTPEIRPLIKRTSALDLQKLLKLNKFYKGSLDGFYGGRTAVGYKNFVDTDLQYKKYALLDNFLLQEKGGSSLDFQEVIDKLPQNPNSAQTALSKNELPLSKAYQAYSLMINGGNLSKINQLMNAAIKETFADKKIKNAPPFDFNVNYSYEDMSQFLLHLRYLHAAPINAKYSIPCWLFENHPKAAFAAFKANSKFASFANTKISTCENFDEWLPIKMMNNIIGDLQPANLTAAQKAKQATLTSARNFQYLFPEKLDKNQKAITDKWLIDFWKQMDSSAETYPVLGKNLITLKVLFFQSQVLLEDYFMDKEFTPDAAEGLALTVLKTYVEVPLEVYGN